MIKYIFIDHITTLLLLFTMDILLAQQSSELWGKLL